VNQQDKAAQFRDLHIKGQPVVLYNAWDAGSAKAIADGGAPAIATSSWSVAEAQGYHDGEDIPFDLANRIIARIVASVDVPVSADFEGGYTNNDGINFEDRVVKGSGLYDIDRQATRIAAIRQAADTKGVALFINARTDLFLGQGNEPSTTVEAALDRAKAYADAGASGFFIPGLQEESLIARIIENAPLPVNVMVMDGVPTNDRLAQIGVARISYGPIPYIETINSLRQAATKLHS
jgi:2-methylisocitrate lyase-like PEP mutase family enzyme